MPGQQGRIIFSAPGRSMYLGETIGVFRENGHINLTRIGQSDVHLRVSSEGAITNGPMLFRLLNDLWNNEAAAQPQIDTP